MHFVYILQSDRNGRFYTGQASDVQVRLKEHNSGRVKATKYMMPWRLVYSEAFNTATEARQREYYLKSQKSRKFLEALIAKNPVALLGRRALRPVGGVTSSTLV